MTFTIPIRVVSEANQSNREHWRKKSKRHRNQRFDTAYMWLTQDTIERSKCTSALNFGHKVKVSMTRIAPRLFDDDNLRGALKAVRDEITKQLGLASDRDTRISFEYGQRKGAPKYYAVEVSINTVRNNAAGNEGE